MLTSAQCCENHPKELVPTLAQPLLKEIEEKRAKERQRVTQLAGKDKDGHYKTSVPLMSAGPIEKSEKKI